MRKKSIIIVLTIFLTFHLNMTCISLDEDKIEVLQSGNFKYILTQPAEKYIMPGRLEEISGLDYLDGDIILCIEDERGVLYFYNTQERKVTREIIFGKSGDYEGVAHTDNTAFVVKSNGKLYAFPINQDDEVDSDIMNTPFSKANDVEGLVAGHKKDELYIACKGSPEVEGEDMEGRAVYTFNFKKSNLISPPQIHLTSEEFLEHLKKNNMKPSKHMPFKPSGIAVHPVTRDIFLIGSVGKLLIVLNKSGQIQGMAHLSRKIYKQPEGITFDQHGNLYIANEGRGGDGYIIRINQLDKNP